MTTVSRQILFGVTSLVVVARRVVFVVEAGVKPASAVPGTAAGCCPGTAPEAVFDRVLVDYRSVGGTRVSWTLRDDFYDAGPFEFRLQVSPSGVPDTDDWQDAGVPATDPAYLVDGTQRTYGVEETVHYRVVMVSGANTYVSRAVMPTTALPVRDWLLIRELARKEVLRQALQVGTPGLLLKARRYGVRCPCVNPITRERSNAACLRCFGNGILGGYHPPLACTFAEVPQNTSRAETSYGDNRGTTQDNTFKARLTPGVPLAQEDVWVSQGDDARYIVHRVWKEVVHRGVPVVYAAEMRRAPRSDIVYRIPVDQALTASCEWGLSEADGDPVTMCLPQTATSC